MNNSNRLKLASSGTDVVLLETDNYSILHKYSFDQPIKTIHWSPDFYQIVAVPSSSDKVYLTLVKSQKLAHTDFCTGEANTVAKFNSVNSRCLAVGTEVGKILIWDTKQKIVSKSFCPLKSEVTCLQFNWNATHIASGYENGRIMLHNVISGLSSTLCESKDAIICLQYSYLSKALVAAATGANSIYLWDVNSQKLVHSFPLSHDAPISGISFSHWKSVSSILVSCGLDKKIRFYDLEAQTAAASIQCPDPVTSVDMKEDGVTIALGDTKGHILVYDLRSMKQPIYNVTAHSTPVRSLMFQKTPSNLIKKTASFKQSFSKAAVDSNPTVAERRQLDLGPKNLPFSNANKRTSYTLEVFSPLQDLNNLKKEPQDNHGNFGDSNMSSRINSLPFASPLPYKPRDSLNVFSPIQYSDSDTSKDNFEFLSPFSLSVSKDVENPKENSRELDQPRPEACSNRKTEENLIVQNLVENISSRILNNVDLAEKFSPMNDLVDDIPPNRENIAAVFENGNHLLQNQEDLAGGDLNNVANDGNALIDEGMGTAGPSSPLTPQGFQAEYIRQLVNDCLEEFADEFRQQLVRNHVSMIRENMELLDEVKHLLSQHASENQLISELNRLRFENEFYKNAFR